MDSELLWSSSYLFPTVTVSIKLLHRLAIVHECRRRQTALLQQRHHARHEAVKSDGSTSDLTRHVHTVADLRSRRPGARNNQAPPLILGRAGPRGCGAGGKMGKWGRLSIPSRDGGPGVSPPGNF